MGKHKKGAALGGVFCLAILFFAAFINTAKADEILTYDTPDTCGTYNGYTGITGWPEQTACYNYIQPFTAAKTGYVSKIVLSINNSLGTRAVYYLYVYDVLCTTKRRINIPDLTTAGQYTITLTSLQFPVVEGQLYGVMFSTASCSQHRGWDMRRNCENSEPLLRTTAACGNYPLNDKMQGQIYIEYVPPAAQEKKNTIARLYIYLLQSLLSLGLPI